ncbi:HAMP domain-containing histidine kinase [Niabella hibiscisoli]|nr:HAMP domain-containing sensor histidine kinase [Niabella hibiscisoli]MCH5718044.1 HAMP domain-containing histidine kinase [Niabella hibiscisoli]
MERITAALTNAPHLQQYLQIMNSNTERLLELTRQLLDFRKIETEHYHLFLTELNIFAVTEKLVHSFSPAIAEKNISFHFTPPSGNIIIAADEEALVKIISNLIDNAIKYCEQQVRIDLEIDQTLNLVRFYITNDGETVPKEMREHIFEPFVRHYHKGVGGSGIGLSLVHSLVQLHQGKMEYKVVNNMNIFSVAFPLKISSVDINIPTNNES